MVLRLLSSCGVLESTILDLDPLACGYLGFGTHIDGGILEPIFMGSLVSLKIYVLNPHKCFDVSWIIYGRCHVVAL